MVSETYRVLALLSFTMEGQVGWKTPGLMQTLGAPQHTCSNLRSCLQAKIWIKYA